MDQRRTGWLDEAAHGRFRTLLVHCCARFFLASPVYCLMPDHAHLLLVGLNRRADQLDAIAWLRREWNSVLEGYRLQDQAYDNVLREEDRQGGAFPELVRYIRKNPVRQGLVENWQDWPHTHCCFPGYPALDLRKSYFWENFWRAYQRQSDAPENTPPEKAPPARPAKA